MAEAGQTQSLADEGYGFQQVTAEISPAERALKAALGPALLLGWWYIAPDYLQILSRRPGELTPGEILWPLGWLLVFVAVLYAAISWFYESSTGHDAVWFWHRRVGIYVSALLWLVAAAVALTLGFALLAVVFSSIYHWISWERGLLLSIVVLQLLLLFRLRR
jgi:hypothetical protein